MLAAFSVPNLEKWGYTNSTLFINPNQPEFQAKDYNEDDYTEQAINRKIAWLYSTNPYNKGNIQGVYSALDAYSQGQYWTQASDGSQVQSQSTETGAPSSFVQSNSAWTTIATASPVSSQAGTSSQGHQDHDSPSPSPSG